MKNFIKEMQNIIKDNLIERFFFAALFGAAFAVIGFYVPRIYFTYLDKTEYYKIYSPVAINQSIPHYPCEPVEVTFTKESLIEGRGQVNIALNLYREDGAAVKQRVGYQEKNILLTKDQQIIDTYWDIDCNRKPGEYYFEGVLTYEYLGLQRSQSFHSEKFTIIEKPEEIK